MKKFLFVLISLFLVSSVYSFTQIITPTNNSIITQLNQTISTTISETENTSTFINWNNSVIGYWNFENNGNDISGNGRHGTFYSGASIQTSNQIRGNYTHFDGYNDYFDLGTNSIFKPSKFTISIWVYSELDDGNNYIFSSGNDWHDVRGVHLFHSVSNGNVYGRYGYDINNNYNGVNYPMSYDTWNHVVLSFTENNNLSLYLNGNFVSSRIDTEEILYGSKSTKIGYTQNGGGTWAQEHKGELDELILFNRALSSDEIKSLHNSQINNFELNVTDLNNLTNYNYEIFTINTTGHLLKQSFNFFTNTSYTAPISQIQTQSVAKLPNQSTISIIISIFLLLIYLII
jgi:hypothetical protein